jgi:hypothetical protein
MDIDFIRNQYDPVTGGPATSFEITLGDNPLPVTGNRALLNRFELTLMTKRRLFVMGGVPVVDSYGGDATKFINRPTVLADTQSIAAALATAVEQTVQSMIVDDQGSNLDDTQKIVSAQIISIDMVSDTVTATIQVIPVKTERFEDLIFNLPITKG